MTGLTYSRRKKWGTAPGDMGAPMISATTEPGTWGLRCFGVCVRVPNLVLEPRLGWGDVKQDNTVVAPYAALVLSFFRDSLTVPARRSPWKCQSEISHSYSLRSLGTYNLVSEGDLSCQGQPPSFLKHSNNWRRWCPMSRSRWATWPPNSPVSQCAFRKWSANRLRCRAPCRSTPMACRYPMALTCDLSLFVTSCEVVIVLNPLILQSL